MRIIGEIPHPVFKVTLFKMDTRYSIKFEDQLFEQTYKFREGPFLQSVEDLKKLISPSFLKEVEAIHQSMLQNSQATLEKHKAQELEEFDEII